MADDPTPHVESASHVDHEHDGGHVAHGGDEPHGGHGPASYDDIRIRSITLVGGIGAVLVFVAVVAVQVVYFRYEEKEFQRKVLDVPLTDVDAFFDAQRQKLATAGEGANSGDRRIPIDEAIDLIVADYEAKRAANEPDADKPDAAKPDDAPAEEKTPDEQPQAEGEADSETP